MNKSVLYILRRFGFYLIAAFAALTLNFIIPRLMPGDPASIIFAIYILFERYFPRRVRNFNCLFPRTSFRNYWQRTLLDDIFSRKLYDNCLYNWNNPRHYYCVEQDWKTGYPFATRTSVFWSFSILLVGNGFPLYLWIFYELVPNWTCLWKRS